MKFPERSIFLCVTIIILISSIKCCIFSKNLVDFGKKLLVSVDEMEFNDYIAIQNMKNSIKMAIESSVMATPKIIREIIDASDIENKEIYIKSTKLIEESYQHVFSLVTPTNSYDVNDFKTVMKKKYVSILKTNSTALLYLMINKSGNMMAAFERLSQKPHEYQCDSTISLHHKLVGYHNRAFFNLIMGYSTLIYLSKQSFRSNLRRPRLAIPSVKVLSEKYDFFTGMDVNIMEATVRDFSRDIYRCDPTEHQHEKTFDRLYELVEYYITSERFLNKNGECSKNPKNYHEVEHSSEINNHIDESLICYGSLYKCKNINLIHLFLYGNDQIYRRYHAYSVADKSPEGEKVFGEIGDATFAYTLDELNAVYSHSSFNSPTPQLIGTRNCSIYGCLCDSHSSPRTVRYFSTKLVTSDIKSNKVITGLRLIVIDRVVYIQIQTGKLLGSTIVNPATVAWQEIEKIDVPETNQHLPNAEYVSLNYYNRSLYLDDLAGFKGYYLTGVHFAPAKDGVRIAGKFTAYKPGNYLNETDVKTLIQCDENRLEINVNDNSHPSHVFGLNSKPISKSNKDYVKFQPSSMVKDAGQTTVPFLDIQSVITKPPMALSGFGVLYKASPDHAGFVALKLITPQFFQDLNNY